MIYDYYCVDCGRKFRGPQISFDLAEFLGIRNLQDVETVRSRITQIGSAALVDLASRGGVQFHNGERARVEITLRELLELMGENIGGSRVRSLMSEYTYTELREAIDMVFTSMASQEVAAGMIQRYTSALQNCFTYTLEDNEPEDEAEADEKRLDTTNYHAFFWLEPEMFPEDKDGTKIYTMKYSSEKNPVHMKKIVCPTAIRGYCPECGQPVLNGTGKYRHTLIGLLGAQSAGKTSLIVSLIDEIQRNFRSYGIKYPGNVLCDSRYHDMELNMELFRNYWAVRKTAAETSAGTFNASLFLVSEDEARMQIVTFIDIAGEQCYNDETREMNSTALDVYPLINSCQLYLLCTCLDQTGYGNAEGEEKIIPPEAVLTIANGIYSNLREPWNVPPLCIVATKADMASDVSAGNCRENPFDKFHLNREFFHKNQIDIMKNIFNMKNDENVREPLRWCCDTFAEMRNKTYVSMMSCSALGRKGELYDGELSRIRPYQNRETGETDPFRPQRMDALWQWILQASGIIPTGGDHYCIPQIFSFGESYFSPGGGGYNAPYGPRCIYPVSQAARRITAVRRLFLNQSELDRKVHDAVTEEVTFVERLRGITPESRVQRAVQEYNRKHGI